MPSATCAATPDRLIESYRSTLAYREGRRSTPLASRCPSVRRRVRSVLPASPTRSTLGSGDEPRRRFRRRGWSACRSRTGGRTPPTRMRPRWWCFRPIMMLTGRHVARRCVGGDRLMLDRGEVQRRAGRDPLLFVNHGVNAGSSQPHPHGQVIGLPMPDPLRLGESAALLRGAASCASGLRTSVSSPGLPAPRSSAPLHPRSTTTNSWSRRDIAPLMPEPRGRNRDRVARPRPGRGGGRVPTS